MRRRTPPARWPQLRLLQLRSSDRAVREHLGALCDDDIAAAEADEDAARERHEIDGDISTQPRTTPEATR